MLKTSFEISDAAKARIEKLKSESVNAKQYALKEPDILPKLTLKTSRIQ